MSEHIPIYVLCLCANCLENYNFGGFYLKKIGNANLFPLIERIYFLKT